MQEMICAQLCGSGHSAMKGALEVMEATDYDAWYKGKADGAMPKAKEELGDSGSAESPKVSANP